ncbi:uncharacterized protein PAC_01250 [Phialocephala subalpina]|uniref:Uncharacterized protein n=1 Tax=Phialocephala subalpina TaxID=576137 RepID=A0A1L7WF20_9HELO|nr:uncharacterized protein PAC_01250 [Phialocephala subalpina]
MSSGSQRIAGLSAVMRISWCFLVIATGTVFAVPAPHHPRAVNSSACAQIAPATAAFLSRNPSATPQVSAQLAMDCLQSVPNKPEPAKALVKSLKAFVQWQSTLAWLKDPPASYMLPATDIEGGLDNISTTAAAGGFASEYDFQLSIFKLNTLSSDIISVSKDGKEVPKLYNLAALNNNTVAPAITKINGQDAATFISDVNLKFSSFQDPDSQWNSMFKTYANPTGMLTVAASLAFQGSSVTLTYDNGQEKTEQSFAIIRPGINFTGVNTGEDFYNKFLNPNSTQSQAANTTSSATPTPTSTSTSSASPSVNTLAAPAPTISGYPFPIVRDSGANTTAGYFLDGTGYDNVAVLSVSAFSPAGNIGSIEYLTNFQSAVASFLSKCKVAGKTRLIIDVSANGGGFVVAGYELFAQLFPDVQRFQADNLRLADSLVNMARISNSIPNNFSATNAVEENAFSVLQNSVVTSNLVPGGVFGPDGSNLDTVEDILGPVSLKGELFTAYQQAPLNQTSAEFNLTGTGTRSNPPPSVFAAENVVLLTDGTCGSTCTIFSYLMILQLNIKTTVVGGRPQTGPMQSVAGVEGAQVFPLDEISAAASAVIALSPSERKAELQAGELGVLADGYALKRLTSVDNPGAVNGKNAFAATDSQTPLQFLWQPANCRIFYTKEMISSPTATWQRTVDATWTDPAAFCVEGSRVAMNVSSQSVDPLFRLGVNNTKF